MSGILYTDIQDAYAASGLTPCRCGPEWHRLTGDGESVSKIAAGPFFALYCHASWLIVAADMSDAAIDALADAAERWARREWGVEYYAAFQAGFEHATAFNLDGAMQCTPVERRGLFDGKLASQMVEAIAAPAVPRLSIAGHYTCNGSPKGCEQSRFGQCDYHDQRKAGVAC